MSILSDIASELNATKNQVVLAWLVQNTPTIIPIIGISKTNQLDENIKSLDIKLSAEQLEKLN